jgi:hypothetical protein
MQDILEAPQEETPVTEEVTQVEDVQAAEQASPEQAVQKNNFAELRQAKEAAERERDAYLNRLKQIENSKQEVPKVKDPEIGDDDLAEGRHLKALRKELDEYKREVTQTTNEARVRSQYPDFDTVVNAKTIDQLRLAYPELANTIGSSGNVYNQAVSAYTMIKKLGIYDGQNHDSAKQAVEKNSGKPRPLSSVSPQQGDSPLSQANAFANGLTPELKKNLYKEMIEARKRM